ncbi:MAG: GrpB family protein [Alphaproteobacteria bacterium]|nr:GrpB family protein [Alphaproteobacteria bacterium]
MPVPPPIAVRLVPHDPRWADRAAAETARLVANMGDSIVRLHHIRSTPIPGIAARPILDLLPEVHDLAVLGQAAPVLRRAGYDAWGEAGIPGRRYMTRDHPATGARLGARARERPVG